MRILFWFFFTLSTSVSAQDNTALFTKANTAYEAGKYAEAISAYKQILATGKHSSEVYFNLGNAAFKKGDLGIAILNYEKANLMSPGDERINQNLSIARDKVDTEIIEIPEFALLRWWRAFSKTFSPWVWTALQCMALLLLAYGIFLWRMKDAVTLKKKGVMMMVGSILALLSFFFAGHTAHGLLHNSQSGIILRDTVLKTAPDLRSEDNKKLSEGVKVKMLDSIDDWYKIQLENKELGWIPVDVIGEI